MEKIYIGITGKKGSLREFGSYLIGNVLETLSNYVSPGIPNEQLCSETIKEECKNSFDSALREYIEYKEDILGSSNKTVVESFGRYILDQMKLFIGGCFNIEINNFCDLENLAVNLEDFSIRYIEKEPLKDNEELLSSFIIRFGECIKKEFGEDAWIKSADSWISLRDEDALFVIYNDIKTDRELDFVLGKNGKIIHITGPDCYPIIKDYNKITQDPSKYLTSTLEFPFKLCDLEMLYNTNNQVISDFFEKIFNVCLNIL